MEIKKSYKSNDDNNKGDHMGSPYILEVLAVVVIYNMDIEESETIISLNKSLDFLKVTLDLVVYDNSLKSDRKSGSIFNLGHFKIHFFHDPSNPGVSKAYNFAAQYGRELKKDWLLLLDQDTSFPVNSIAKYKLAVKQNPEIKLIAPILTLSNGKPISPCQYFLKRGFALKTVCSGLYDLKNNTLLNSGILINLDVFSFIGGYNENIKLDFCDFLFIEQFKKLYIECFILDIKCVHDFADNSMDIVKLNDRYLNYCRDAKNCSQESFWERIQYFVVVFLRASSLALRTKNFVFYRTLFDNFIR